MQGTNPRAARIAALIQRVIATNMESLHDKRLANVTITDVQVTNDLQLAKVFWTVLGHEGHEDGERKRAQQALNQAKGRLRSLVGRKAGLRLTPDLKFVFDEVPGEAHEIEDILIAARKRDEQLKKLRETATYAGEENPYREESKREDYLEMEPGTQADDVQPLTVDPDEYDEFDGDTVEVEEFEDEDTD